MAIKLYKELFLANSIFYGHSYINCMNNDNGYIFCGDFMIERDLVDSREQREITRFFTNDFQNCSILEE